MALKDKMRRYASQSVPGGGGVTEKRKRAEGRRARAQGRKNQRFKDKLAPGADRNTYPGRFTSANVPGGGGRYAEDDEKWPGRYKPYGGSRRSKNKRGARGQNRPT